MTDDITKQTINWMTDWKRQKHINWMTDWCEKTITR